MEPIRFTFYVKGTCGLCEDAAEVLTEVRRSLALPSLLETVDITTDSALMAAYRYEIPVLLINGRPAFRYRIDPERLRARLLHGTPAPLEEPDAHE